MYNRNRSFTSKNFPYIFSKIRIPLFQKVKDLRFTNNCPGVSNVSHV